MLTKGGSRQRRDDDDEDGGLDTAVTIMTMVLKLTVVMAMESYLNILSHSWSMLRKEGGPL